MKGCLLIHGYTGGPFEVEPLADCLKKEGFITLCPTLHGHGGIRKNLRYSSYKKWLDSADQAYKELSKHCDEITVVGFSMGGLLAFQLAHKYKPKCIVSMSTPIYCIDFKNLKDDLLLSIRTSNHQRLKEYFFSCFTPMVANLNFRILLHHSKRLLPELNLPVMVVQGTKDAVVRAESARFIYHRIPSPQKSLCFYEKSNHLLHYSCEKDRIYDNIINFIKLHG